MRDECTMSEQKTNSAKLEEADGKSSGSVTGANASQGLRRTIAEPRDNPNTDKRVTRARDVIRPGGSKKDSLGPDIVDAINVAGDVIKEAGDVAGSINNIAVTAGGTAYAIKKGLEKIRGDKNKNSETRGDTDRTES